ncbi:hypothetical protein PMIN06_002310 [Paraphaeosphaeria minitans]
MAQVGYQEAYGKAGDINSNNTIDMTPTDTVAHQPKGVDATGSLDGTGVPTLVASHEPSPVLERDAATKGSWMAYVKTKQFWIAMVLGQTLAICITSTNTLSQLLSNEGTSIPAFQSLFNYILLNIVYTGYTLYRLGLRGWARMVLRDGWRFFILAFIDVLGNYFIVLAYRYTTILSAQLINFWAIVVVVILSFLFLKVRYRWAQIAGILLCVGGVGVLFGSDHITGFNQYDAPDAVKGDLFALLGASLYGVSNTLEEFLVSEEPLYVVIGQLGFWGMFINGTVAGIFDRASFRAATWTPDVGGYLAGYTLILSLFYSLAPILFRLTSAAFFNISLLTGNFWGVAIGVKVFRYHIHWMYPIAFVLILVGQIIYFLRQGSLAEQKKPWLGDAQDKGVSGIGTAKRRVENPDAIV